MKTAVSREVNVLCRYFTQKSVLERVPTCFLLLGGILTGTQLLCLLSVTYPPSRSDNSGPSDSKSTEGDVVLDGKKEQDTSQGEDPDSTEDRNLEKDIKEKEDKNVSVQEQLTANSQSVSSPVERYM